MSLVPYVIEQTARGERFIRYFSRLLNDRIVMLSEDVNSTTASLVVARSFCIWKGRTLTKISALYINSPGGSITAGMAIYDTMQYIKCDVSTICGYGCLYGVRAAGGRHKGQAPCVAEQRILIHQPLIGGQVGLQGGRRRTSRFMPTTLCARAAS